MADAPSIYPGRKLDANGRCCGRKPMPYKKPPHLFCPRCDTAFAVDGGKQIANWAWLDVGGGWFRPRYPDASHVQIDTKGERG